MPFEAISQRIKRKYDIDKLIEKLPVEVNVFDVLYFNGKSYLNTFFKERRKLIEKIVKTSEKKIKVAEQIITDNEDRAMTPIKTGAQQELVMPEKIPNVKVDQTSRRPFFR